MNTGHTSHSIASLNESLESVCDEMVYAVAEWDTALKALLAIPWWRSLGLRQRRLAARCDAAELRVKRLTLRQDRLLRQISGLLQMIEPETP